MQARVALPFFAFLLSVLVSPAADPAGDWPGWRGTDRTDISPDKGLLKAWGKGGPKRLWLFKDAGRGYSGPAISGGRLFTMGAREDKTSLIAIDVASGKEAWSAEIGETFKGQFADGPRGTPWVDGDRVYALSGVGDLVCARVADGGIVWRASLPEMGSPEPGFGYSESLLVDGDRLIWTPGGIAGALAALDKMTGSVLWRSVGLRAPVQYSSVIPAKVDGEKQYIQLFKERLAGVSAEDGKLLWTSPWPGQRAVVPTPIYRNGHVYVTSGYDTGCKLVRLGKSDSATEVYSNTEMINHHGGVVLVDDHLYGYSDGTGWICQEFLTGKVVWSEKKALGKGAIHAADGKLYCLAERDGTVVLIDATPLKWIEAGRFKLDPPSELRDPKGNVWTHPVVVGGRLYLRDQNLIHCFNVNG